MEKAKQKELAKINSVVDTFMVVMSEASGVGLGATANLEKSPSGTNAGETPGKSGENAANEKSEPKETVKGTIFDDKMVFRQGTRRHTVKHDLSGVIFDLEQENQALQSPKILEILERLKEIKKHL